MNRMIVMSIALTAVLSVLPCPSQAQPASDEGTVLRTGTVCANDGSGMVVFCVAVTVDSSRVVKWYRAPSDREKEMLSIALTAMSNMRKVRIIADTLDSAAGTFRDPILVRGLFLTSTEVVEE